MMGKSTLVLHSLLLVCCISITFQASLDTERSFDLGEGQEEEQRAVDLREEDELPSEELKERSVDREERASKGCGFHCEAGEKAVQNDTNIPRANGCGPYGIKLSFVDEAAEECCKAHDYCYEICGKSRLDCDVMLRDCIQGLRKKRDTTRFRRGWHSMMGSVFYRTVRTFGCKAYKRGQSRGCMCVKDESYDPSEVVAEEPPSSGFKFNVFSGFSG